MKLADYISRYWADAEAIYAVMRFEIAIIGIIIIIAAINMLLGR